MVQILSLESWTYSLFSFLAILLSSLSFAFSEYLSLVLHLVFIVQAFNSQLFPYYSLNLFKVNILSMMCSDSSSIPFFSSNEFYIPHTMPPLVIGMIIWQNHGQPYYPISMTVVNGTKAFIWLQHGKLEFFSGIDIWVLAQKNLLFQMNSYPKPLGHCLLVSGKGLYEIGEDETNVQNEAVISRDKRLKAQRSDGSGNLFSIPEV